MTSIFLNNSLIQPKSEIKFLGVLLDDKFTFGLQIKTILSKISKSIAVMYRNGNLVPQSCLYSLHYSFIYSYFLYCM